jgi:hypothetical protein
VKTSACTFMVISHAVLPRMTNVSDKRGRENQSTTFISNNFFSETSAVGEIMWKNMLNPDRPQMTIECAACAVHAG